MSNVLDEDKKQQVLALGRLHWSLRSIEAATGVRRETASRYLKAAGVDVRPPRARDSKPASEVTTDPGSKPASQVTTDSEQSKAASEVTTDLGLDPSVLDWPPPRAGRAPSARACQPYRELIELALGRGRNAMAIFQDLVDEHGFAGRYTSVRRFVAKLRGAHVPEARNVIVTAPGEEAHRPSPSSPHRIQNSGEHSI